MNKKHTQLRSRGFTLLLSVIIAGIVLAVGLVLLSIAQRQFQISRIGRRSEIAFQAADAGVECMKYWDRPKHGAKFNPGSSGTISCFGNILQPTDSTKREWGTEQPFEFTWDNGTDPIGSGEELPSLCTKVSIWKFTTGGDMESALGTTTPTICNSPTTCTVIVSDGYNESCGNVTSISTVERELLVRY